MLTVFMMKRIIKNCHLINSCKSLSSKTNLNLKAALANAEKIAEIAELKLKAELKNTELLMAKNSELKTIISKFSNELQVISIGFLNI